MGKKEQFNFFQERTKSNDSSISNSSLLSNVNFFNKRSNDKSLENKKGNANISITPGMSLPKTPKDIPLLNLEKHLSSKQNNLFTINKRTSLTNNNNNLFSYKSQVNNNSFLKINLTSSQNNNNNKYPFFIKTQSNNESNSSDELILEYKMPTDRNKYYSSLKDRKKNDSYNNYPYTSRNEFINYAFNKFKRKIKDPEIYIKNYLSKIKGYDNDKIEDFINEIYNKNIKKNIKELEKQINDNDLYSKTERLYLNSHLIKRIKPLLNSMGENDKTIQRLEKNLTEAVSNK